MDLVATGQRRFEVESLDESEAYLRAEVGYFDDPLLETETLPSGELSRLDTPRLSFKLGQLIADVDRRQLLLSLRSEVERLEYLVKMLPDYTIQRERTALAKRVGPLNGHAKHVVNS